MLTKMDIQGSRNTVPRPRLEPHGFFWPRCYRLTYRRRQRSYRHDLRQRSYRHDLCQRSHSKPSALHLQPLLRFIVSFLLLLSHGEHRYRSAPCSPNGLQQLVECLTHLAIFLMFKTLVVRSLCTGFLGPPSNDLVSLLAASPIPSSSTLPLSFASSY